MAQITDVMTNEKTTAEHHVHFDQTTLKEEDFETESSSVTYQQVGKNIVDVHLGFLQHNHRYLIELHLPANLFKCQPNVPINLVADNNITPNVHCKLAADRVTELLSDSETEKFFVIKVEYFAHKEKLLREELKLVNANNLEELLKLFVSARVLGKGKGTPMLRNGIHCLGYEATGESDGESSSKSDHNQPPILVSAGANK
ncbi:UPF0687 protein C20orf27 homolog [Contarinia nasturtii]|uniref:UPF0687 protein C20orf27 homolog n=1 Tax=Contarinia nasturtii TaxID=265458 RepID=UPI0012D3E982|nr:UPF0687 protein C20orf27 homolog [Contarinia nasturtii]XP_031637389.1 UPF0687 protein C20orf27 homolog [Contarinia nasturtii]